MVPHDGGGTRGRSADLDALPAGLAGQSLSRTAIILPLDAALEAIALRTGDNRRLENWEGWVRMPDGGRAKSLSHGGSFALPQDATRAAAAAAAGMKRAQLRWERDPEYEHAALYFGLTFGAAAAAGDASSVSPG
ncbi:MAG: hypothetical protein WD801_01305 [Gemmatimonadaceae bacterium]